MRGRGALCGEPAWLDQALAAAPGSRSRGRPPTARGRTPRSRTAAGSTASTPASCSRAWRGVARATGDAHAAGRRCTSAAPPTTWLSSSVPTASPSTTRTARYPYDALSAAQGVETLHVALGGHAARAVPGQLAWIRRHLVRPDGRVAYQVHRALDRLARVPALVERADDVRAGRRCRGSAAAADAAPAQSGSTWPTRRTCCSSRPSSTSCSAAGSSVVVTRPRLRADRAAVRTLRHRRHRRRRARRRRVGGQGRDLTPTACASCATSPDARVRRWR